MTLPTKYDGILRNGSEVASLVCPEVNIIIFGKTKKSLNPQIHPQFFGSGIQERTY
jgi:hypothetical protein